MIRSLWLLARIAALTVTGLTTRALFLRLVPAPDSATALPEALLREAAVALPQVAFLTATALAAVVMRSRWHGLRLLGTLVALQFGLGTLLPLLELLAFPAYASALPGGQVLHTLLLGIVSAVAVGVVALVLFGRFRPFRGLPTGPLSTRHWAARLAGAAVIFVAATMAAAYLAISRQPVVAFFHGLAGAHSFGSWLQTALALYPLLPGVEALRAMVAAATLLPMIAGDRGPRHLTATLAGALTSVLVGAPLLVPTPWLPETVRLSHLREVIWSMLPLGFVLAELALMGQGTPAKAGRRVSE